MKKCQICKIEKLIVAFNKNRSQRDGLQTGCIDCMKVLRRSYLERYPNRVRASRQKYREENQDKLKAFEAERYSKNPEKEKARAEAYRLDNKEKIKASQAAYYAANSEKRKSYTSEWRSKNPGAGTVFSRNRRAIERNAEGKHTRSEVMVIFESQRGLCANCESKLFKSGVKKYHVDHIMPLARGGSNDKYNLQCLCPTCNLKKKDKDHILWAQLNGRLL